eukprot:14295101-Ditylum_brightwellii.AAC.2
MSGWINPLLECILIQVGHASYSVLTKYWRPAMEDITKHARLKFMSHNMHHQNNIQLYYYCLNFVDRNSKIQILQEDRQL